MPSQDLSKLYECKHCHEWREADKQGNCDHCGRLIAPRRQGPDAGNDPVLLAQYGVE